MVIVKKYIFNKYIKDNNLIKKNSCMDILYYNNEGIVKAQELHGMFFNQFVINEYSTQEETLDLITSIFNNK